MDPLHVLLVDHSGRQQAVGAVLRAAGHRVASATGPEATQGLSSPGFDLLVLDLALPGLDRAGLSRAIHPDEPAPPESLADAERRHIARTLEYTRGNRRRAAQILGIARSTLLHKVRRYGLGG